MKAIKKTNLLNLDLCCSCFFYESSRERRGHSHRGKYAQHMNCVFPAVTYRRHHWSRRLVQWATMSVHECVVMLQNVVLFCTVSVLLPKYEFMSFVHLLTSAFSSLWQQGGLCLYQHAKTTLWYHLPWPDYRDNSSNTCVYILIYYILKVIFTLWEFKICVWNKAKQLNSVF